MHKGIHCHINSNSKKLLKIHHWIQKSTNTHNRLSCNRTKDFYVINMSWCGKMLLSDVRMNMKVQWNLEFLPSSYLSWFLASSLNVPTHLLSFIPFLEEAKLLLRCFYLNAYPSKKIYTTTPPKTPTPSVFAHRLILCLALTTAGIFVHSLAFLHWAECKLQKSKHLSIVTPLTSQLLQQCLPYSRCSKNVHMNDK